MDANGSDIGQESILSKYDKFWFFPNKGFELFGMRAWIYEFDESKKILADLRK